MSKIPAIASWSGGKDSCLACYKAMCGGYDIKYLLNFISREYRRCCFHGVEEDLLKLQAQAIGIPLVQKAVTADMKEYEKEFKEAVAGLSSQDIGSIVFGDIYLADHASWVERVCGELEIKPVEPLWDEHPAKVLEEFIDAGFKAVIVSCQAEKLGEEFVGKCLEKNMVKEFEARGVCPCGENGEFHTLVVDGPIFRQKIELLASEKVFKKDFWEYWFLDIKKYRLSDKQVDFSGLAK
ncbi:MAG: diphthine--ammonia ligase [Candidatus Omnitrophica bacterium]|nr:diphthine--ammonia ligase [Candidatus Omnitrophota bacterium]